ncbi:MAG: nickel pincer cofactor biosynthesis protein LarC, partial [Lachnospiraceae bacterium]|nr:nickel pincer cofactor biosynthesis protein LarC [Lachnospiraceae bacterium]
DHHHDHDHEHHHDHNHDHGAHPHVHHGMREISDIVEHLQIPSSVRERVLQVYRLIADAESRVHGVPVTEIHFHEVGALDAVADIAAVMMLLHRINPDEVIVSPLCVGSGTVRCAHGILPVPAPATALLLEGMPFYSDERRGELLTPTGAAVLKTIATSFGSMPVMTGSSFGYGMGKKDFPWANCVRIVSGERCEAAGTAAAVSAETGKQTAPGEVLELSCNLDDVTAEQIGYALGKIFEEGALDAWTVPIGMKKSRPGTMLQVLCREEDREKIMQCLFRETTTLGIREAKYIRRTLERHLEYVDTPDMKVRVKVSEGYGVRREKAEYDDLAELARREDLTFAEAAELIARIRAGRIC